MKDFKIEAKELLSTGSTLLNLVLTGNPYGGFLKGKYYYYVGDSASGKTILSMNIFAEATINPAFDGYDLIYDNVEDGMLIDLDAMYSEAVADRVRPPNMVDGVSAFSDTIEGFYYNLDDALRRAGWDSAKRVYRPTAKTRPFVYVLDSMDGLTSESSDKKYIATKAADRKRRDRLNGAAGAEREDEDEKVAGSYGDAKAKINSEQLRRAMPGIKQTGSMLIIISQTRDDIGARFANAKTRSGGRALTFYATTEVWSSVVKKHYKDVRGKAREVGSRVKYVGRKNRINGQNHATEFDIYWSVGIDDVGSLIDYLVAEGWWDKTGTKINAPEIGHFGTREKLIRMVEKEGQYDALRETAGKCWASVREACRVPRLNRYAARVDPNDADASQGEE
jgi:hypothetical protein